MQTFRARYVLPVTRPPIENGTVTIADGRIVAVGDSRPSGPIEDLGNVALLPGFVNAHTHLEFSDLAAPLGVQGNTLVDWIRTLIAHRRDTNDLVGPIKRGIEESLRHGVTTLADIAQLNSLDQWADIAPSNSSSNAVFLELLAPTLERVVGPMEAASRFLAERDSHVTLKGLSPHAPYSVHPELLRQAIDLAVRERVPVAMHLAESPEEMQLLTEGRGPMREFLESVGGWDADAPPGGRRPLDYLQALARADRSLVIHGNYLDDEEIAFAAAQRDRMSVVYCPRTHAFFGHNRYPLEKMLSARAGVALGTDSRASNPDLSILTEMRYVFKTFPNVSPAKILEMGTLAGAEALGLGTQHGSLQIGKLARLCAVPLDDESSGHPNESILSGDSPVTRIL